MMVALDVYRVCRLANRGGGANGRRSGRCATSRSAGPGKPDGCPKPATAIRWYVVSDKYEKHFVVIEETRKKP